MCDLFVNTNKRFENPQTKNIAPKLYFFFHLSFSTFAQSIDFHLQHFVTGTESNEIESRKNVFLVKKLLVAKKNKEVVRAVATVYLGFSVRP